MTACGPQRKSHLQIRCHAAPALPVRVEVGWSRRTETVLPISNAIKSSPTASDPPIGFSRLGDDPANEVTQVPLRPSSERITSLGRARARQISSKALDERRLKWKVMATSPWPIATQIDARSDVG